MRKSKTKLKQNHFPFFVEHHNWQAFQNELRDDTLWREKADYMLSVVSFRSVLLSRNHIFLSAVSVIYHRFSALTDYFQPFPSGSLFSPSLCLFGRTVLQQMGLSGLFETKSLVWWSKTLISVSIQYLDYLFTLIWILRLFVLRSQHSLWSLDYHHHHIKAINTKFVIHSVPFTLQYSSYNETG